MKSTVPLSNYVWNVALCSEIQSLTQLHYTCTIHSGGKRKRCGQCAGCKSDDCSTCPNCRDMKKFGGSGRKKQACVKRKCLDQVSQTQDESKSSKLRSPCSLTVVKHTFRYVYYEPLNSKSIRKVSRK